jgi:hypothetical protein
MRTKRFFTLLIFSCVGLLAFSQPTITIGTPSPSSANSGTIVSFVVTYTGATTVNLTNSDVTINHTGTADGTIVIIDGNTSTPTIEIDGVTGDGTYTISIDAGTSQDGVGTPDAGAGPSDAVTVDNTGPTVAIGSPSPSSANSSTTVSFVVTYTDASTVNLTNSDVTINHSGTAGGTITVTDGATSTPTVEVNGVTGDGSYTISIAAG